MKSLWKTGLCFAKSQKLTYVCYNMFKVVKDISTKTIKEVFHFFSRSNIYLWQAPIFYSRRVKSVHYGKNSFSFIGPRILELLSIEIRSSSLPTEFKRNLSIGNPWIVPASSAIFTSSSKLFFIRVIFIIVNFLLFLCPLQ